MRQAPERRERLRWLALATAFALIAVLAAGIWSLHHAFRKPARRLPDGSTLTLASVSYGSTHQLIEGEWWQTLLAPLLPPRLQPQPNRWTNTYNAPHPKTLVLWTHQEKMTPVSHWDQELWEMRVVASDEHGCRSETGKWGHGAGLNWPPTEAFQAWALPAFPRRGRTVTVQIEERSRGGGTWSPVASFTVPNPDPGPHPRWSALPLPATAPADDLSATLTRLETGLQHQGAGAAAPEAGWSQATFRLAHHGRPTYAWAPAAITLSDATGNLWTPQAGAVSRAGQEQHFPFRTLLWPDEATWKLRVRFEQKAAFAPEQLWTTPLLPVPVRRRIHRVDADVTRHGATLRLLGIAGPAAAIPDGFGWDAIRPILHTRLSPASAGLRVAAVRVTDDRGRAVAVTESLFGGAGKYSFKLHPSPGTGSIRVTLALHRSRFAEFVAAPSASPARAR